MSEQQFDRPGGTFGRIVISSEPQRPVRAVRRRRRRRSTTKRTDPLLWSFIAFCAVGVALQTLLLFLGSIRVGLSDVEGALFAIGAVVFSPAGLVLLLLGAYWLYRDEHKTVRSRRSTSETRRLR